MSKAFISSVNVSGSGSGKGKGKGKGKDNSKSSGNLELNITDITDITDIDLTNGGKVKKSKREKIDLNNLKTIENKPQPNPVVEEIHDIEEKPQVDTNIKIDNTLAVALKPSSIPYIETPWSIIGAYFRNQHLKRLVRHQIESYNDFVNNQIQRTIEMFNPVLIASEQDMCRRTKKNKLELHVTFDKFNLYRPQIHENNGATKIMFPRDARSRNFTYASTMTIDINIRYVVRTGENLENAQTFYKSVPKVHIGKLPIMLKSSICVLNQYTHINNNVSGECKHDAGGYFIINGSEKTVLGQERAAENRVYCFNTSKNNNKWSWTAEIKSVPDFKCISPKQINVMVANKNNGFGCPIYVQIPRIKQPIALFVVFRALGIMADKDICKHIVLDIDDESAKPILNSLQASIIDANTVMSQEDALKIITSNVMYTPMNMDKEAGAAKKRIFTQDVLNNDLFPHCHNAIQKVYFLGYMVNRVLRCTLDMAKQDDRDSYVNKRVDLTGALLNNLFRNYFNKLVKDMSKQIIKEINTGSWRSTDDHMNIVNKTNIYKIIKSTTIENGIKRALSTGDFGIKNVNSNKVGVAQVLNRLTYVSSLSHLRRINTPVDKSGKLIAPRKLHNTTWGFLCVAETPEGGSVGVVKNISYMTHLTIPSNSESLHQHVEPFISRMDNLTPKDMFVNIKVFVNGAWLGNTASPVELYNTFKEKKSKGIINIYTSVVFDIKNKEIRICNDAGRLTRPVLRVRDNKVFITDKVIKELNAENLTWDDLLTDTKIDEAIIEYIDPEEQNFSMIAMKPAELVKKEDTNFIYKFTHCEIHPSTIFGILASCIPFPEHNQSPRNTYQCLDVNETVLMKDGKRIPIKDVKVGDEVITYNPNTFEMEATKVVNHFIRHNDNPVYKLVTLSGREIIATEDHRFSTNNGWKSVKNIIDNNTNKVGIIITNYNNVEEYKYTDNDRNSNCILNEELFIQLMRDLNIDETQNRKVNKIESYVFKLKKIGLIPLYENNPKLEILSRVIGYLYADGSINIYNKSRKSKYNYKEFQCSFDFGTINDATEMQNDLLSLGFDNVKILEGTRTFKCSDSDRFQTHHTFATTYNGCLPAFLISLGVSYGKKTETKRNKIQDWIMNNNVYSSQFMKGFQGGDGCKIRCDKVIDKRNNKEGYNIKIQETSQQINYIFKNELKEFMEQCVIILKNLKINVTSETIKETIIGENRIKYSFTISSKIENLINYYDKIGYSYCETKNKSSFMNVEYLKYKMFNKKNNNKDKLMNIEEWNKIVEYKNNCIFVPIKSITKETDRLISDIEVESENHSFIAGDGFASSNCAMGKQAMGMYVTNYQERMDKTAYVLTYPSRPLVDTRVMGMIKLDQIPSGSAVIVAIMTYSGYNQEDSILVNKGSIDRGLFNATIYHTEKDEDKKINGDEEIRCKPDPSKTKGMKFGNYDKVNNKGLVPENTFIENRDIIIAKVVPIKENRNDHTKLIKYEDHSKIHRTTEESYIDKNFVDRNGDGYCIAKVRIRTSRKPVIGDKLSSRHGQKGTVGNIIPEGDMPFTVNGMRPDIIINPHAIPSRMTIGQLKETLLGKVLVQLGLFGDGTSFGELAVDDIRKELLKVGHECHGNEILYNGMTGEQIESDIFIGPAFYQRLKHMVNDKQHSRSIGPMVNLTRQPAEGRSRDGGLRFGEMERDCGLGSTPITLSNGISLRLDSLDENNGCVNIMGWSEEKNGMVPSRQVAFMDKGTRECVQLTYEDGRKITFTEDHPVLTSDNTWVKIKDIELNSTKIKTSITCPLVDINEEIKECAGWTLQYGTRILETNTREEFMKTLAFARIIGYLITDGHMNSKIKIADLFLGHMLDVESIMKDIELFCESKQTNFNSKNLYIVRIPAALKNDIIRLPGLISGKKVNQPGTLPKFILDEKCPRPIVREFLAGMFGGDGHTCVLSMHRGKRDILSSVSFSQTKTYEHRVSLQKMFEDIQKLLSKCGIHNTTIQSPKETSFSKKKFEEKDKADKSERSFQLTLHVPIEQLIPFSEKVGFRYCCHKSQRLEAGVSYRRLREEVTRQHNWMVNRVNEITKFKEIKEKTPDKTVPTKKAIIQAVDELKKTEGLLHEYAIPSTHDITDHLIKGTEFGKFTAKGFPTAEEFLEKIGALDWFKSESVKCLSSEDDEVDAADAAEHDAGSGSGSDLDAGNYGVTRDCGSIPTMNLTVVSRIPVGPKQVYDISVEDTHSFLANGIVAHNCMVSHGAARFTRGRLYDASDKYQVHVCRDCGMIAAYNDKMGIHCCRTCDNRTSFAYVEIPYACKLLFQELQTMNIAPRIMT
jgi:DNA-directed RNA polymerase beta subunit/intein/homing endonuclease